MLINGEKFTSKTLTNFVAKSNIKPVGYFPRFVYLETLNLLCKYQSIL